MTLKQFVTKHSLSDCFLQHWSKDKIVVWHSKLEKEYTVQLPRLFSDVVNSAYEDGKTDIRDDIKKLLCIL